MDVSLPELKNIFHQSFLDTPKKFYKKNYCPTFLSNMVVKNVKHSFSDIWYIGYYLLLWDVEN